MECCSTLKRMRLRCRCSTSFHMDVEQWNMVNSNSLLQSHSDVCRLRITNYDAGQARHMKLQSPDPSHCSLAGRCGGSVV